MADYDPSQFGRGYQQRCQRLAAWKAHYMAKGCSEHKAWIVARRRHGTTLPPQPGGRTDD